MCWETALECRKKIEVCPETNMIIKGEVKEKGYIGYIG